MVQSLISPGSKLPWGSDLRVTGVVNWQCCRPHSARRLPRHPGHRGRVLGVHGHQNLGRQCMWGVAVQSSVQTPQTPERMFEVIHQHLIIERYKNITSHLVSFVKTSSRSAYWKSFNFCVIPMSAKFCCHLLSGQRGVFWWFYALENILTVSFKSWRYMARHHPLVFCR